MSNILDLNNHVSLNIMFYIHVEHVVGSGGNSSSWGAGVTFASASMTRALGCVLVLPTLTLLPLLVVFH